MRISIGQLIDAFGLGYDEARLIVQSLPAFIKRKYLRFDYTYREEYDNQKGLIDVHLEKDLNKIQRAATRYLEIVRIQIAQNEIHEACKPVDWNSPNFFEQLNSQLIVIDYWLGQQKEILEKCMEIHFDLSPDRRKNPSWLLHAIAAEAQKEREGNDRSPGQECFSFNPSIITKREAKHFLETRIIDLLINLATVERDAAARFITKEFGYELVKEVRRLSRATYETIISSQGREPENKENSGTSDPEGVPTDLERELPELFCPKDFPKALENESSGSYIERVRRENFKDLMEDIKFWRNAGKSDEEIAHTLRREDAPPAKQGGIAVIGAVMADKAPASKAACTKTGQRFLGIVK